MTILRRGNCSSLNKKKLVLLIELSRLRIEDFFSLPFIFKEKVSSHLKNGSENDGLRIAATTLLGKLV